MIGNLLILPLLFIETHILCLGEAFHGWGAMPSLSKKQGKSNFVAGRSWILLPKFTSHEAFWNHHRLECQSTLKSDPWEFPRVPATRSSVKTFGSAAVKYFNSRLPDSHFSWSLLVLNPSKLLVTKTTFCFALRQKYILKEAWEI